MSIRVKILIWFSLLGIIPTILIGAYYGYQSERSIESKVLEMSLGSARQTMTAINDRISYIEKALNTSIQNDVIMETLNALPQQDVVTRTFDERKISRHFNAVVFNNPYIKSIAIVPNETQSTVYGEGTANDQMSEYVRYFLEEQFRQTALYMQISSEPNQMQWTVLKTGDRQNICLVKNFSYFLYAKQMGVIVFIIDSDAFEDYILAPSAGTSSFITTSENLDIQTMLPIDSESNLLAKTKAGAEVLISETKTKFDISAPLSNGWSYGQIISKDYLYDNIRQTRSNTFLFIFFTSIIFLFMALMASHSIGNRMNKLMQKFKRLESGDFTIDTVLSGNDEMVALENGYNKMLDRLSQIIYQNYVYQLEKKEAQLTALQYQINPHFLYNILEVINSMAAVHHAEDIREVAQCLGRLYRYNMASYGGRPTILEDELHHIENYSCLHNIQMSNRLKVFYDIDDETKKCEVIRFILQPIVENAIKHGFNGKGGICCLEISAHIRERGVLSIQITDDGVGMNAETLAIVRQELSMQKEPVDGKKSGIGLRNVNARIRLKYGAEYGLTLQSGDSGTTVTLTLPSGELK